MPLTNYALDLFVAPKLSELSENNAPDLDKKPEEIKWVYTFVFYCVLHLRSNGLHRQYIFNFLRRVEAAHQEYLSAQSLLGEFLEGKKKKVSQYLSALLHFEICIAQAYQAYMLAKKMVGIEKLFDKNDGSSLARLNLLYNETKHSDSVIESGVLPDNFTVPMWITNKGLASNSAELSFVELIEMLNELGFNADRLAYPQVSKEDKTES